MTVSSRPLVLLTSGDPCGVGPELILKVLQEGPPTGVRLAVLGDLAVFDQAAKILQMRLPRWKVLTPVDSGSAAWPRLAFVDFGHHARFKPGQTSEQAGAASLRYVEFATQLCRQGMAHALVTAPVTKWAIERSARGFQGHTEYLAKAFGVSTVAMGFVSDELSVVLLTRHVPLREVSVRVTKALLKKTTLAAVEGLQTYFGIRHPRLAVCGLNPHAGEGGLFGNEEQRVLAPAMRELKSKGVMLKGPFAADGFFTESSGYDAVLCWYHDQGLIPFKLLARDQGCQISFGLPIIRTSPDHGSALDIAGQGRAHPGSLRYALHLAAKLARRRASRHHA